jgi:hypothetical protein
MLCVSPHLSPLELMEVESSQEFVCDESRVAKIMVYYLKHIERILSRDNPKSSPFFHPQPSPMFCLRPDQWAEHTRLKPLVSKYTESWDECQGQMLALQQIRTELQLLPGPTGPIPDGKLGERATGWFQAHMRDTPAYSYRLPQKPNFVYMEQNLMGGKDLHLGIALKDESDFFSIHDVASMSIGFVEAQTRFCGNCYRPMRRNFFL